MAFDTRQIRLFAALFLGIVLVLVGLWYALLRTEYAAIYQNIRESDASQIIAELDNAGIPYQLGNNGHDILVPENLAADARVTVAGADIAMGGTTGFELFNENDLGLTEFAQKINLQRAIQGELARTIMMMDGVRFARVHLALPERTLFRAEQEVPTAAVTVEMQASRSMTDAAVTGIRQLVASSVPGLDIANVWVLDDRGGLASASPANDASTLDPARSEREALETLLKIQATDAVAQIIPRQSFDLAISAFDRVDIIGNANGLEAQREPEAQASPPDKPNRSLHKRSLRVLVRTPAELSAEERSAIAEALTRKIDFSTANGDVLDFTLGATITASAQPTSLQNSEPPVAAAAAEARESNPPGIWDLMSSVAALVASWQFLVAIVLLVVLIAARPRRKLSDSESEEFAELLRDAAIDLRSR